MSLALTGRFLGTFIMHYVNVCRLLCIFGVFAALFTSGAILIDGIWGLYSLVAISLFMSIMFPSIYGIALEKVNAEDTSLGAAFLVMAIVGGALMPPLQGHLIDQQVIFGWPAVNVSFILPFIYLLLHVFTWLKLRRIHEGRQLNECLGETARNIFVYGLCVAIGLLLI
jgi:FHS family L-fucose permease-like MFS transporter